MGAVAIGAKEAANYSRTKSRSRWIGLLFAGLLAAVAGTAQDKPAAPALAKAVGTIKSIQGDALVVSAESGNEVTAKVSNSTKILRVPPGEKDLKNATALQLQDLQAGDRVLVRGVAGDGGALTALAVIVMKQSDVAEKQQREREDWQKRGVAGLVTRIEPGTITISSGGLAANRAVVVHVAKSTVLRRYAAGSVRFNDAKAAPFEQIRAGDQLRARGTRSADGSSLEAEEVVSGSFRNIAGTVRAVDTSSSTATVQDVIGKTAVAIRIGADSQMKKLPPEMAERIAAGLKRTRNGGAGPPAQPPGGPGGPPASAEVPPGRPPGGENPFDLQRMLSRLPNRTLADLQKGDAVMIVASDPGNDGPVTVITMLAGVEAILTAAPDQSASSLLSPWTLSTSGEGENGQR